MPNSDVSGLAGLGHTSCPRRRVWDGPVPGGPARGPSTCEDGTVEVKKQEKPWFLMVFE